MRASVFESGSLWRLALASCLLLFAASAINSQPHQQNSNSVDFADYQPPKTDCHPLKGATEEKCRALGCIWQTVNTKKGTEEMTLTDDDFKLNIKKGYVQEPWCYMPEDRAIYEIESDSNGEVVLKLAKDSGVPNDIKRVKVTAQTIGDSTLRLRITDADKERHEPKVPKMNYAQLQSQNTKAKLVFRLFGGNRRNQINPDSSEPIRLVVIRQETGAVLFDTDLRKLIFADQFMQLNSNLDSKYIFGLGEHFDRFTKTADSYKVYSHFNTDGIARSGGTRSYGTIPFYVALDSNNTKAHAVFLHNSNGIDTILQGDQSISFRVIGGIYDFYIFAGPTPFEAVAQYQKLVGLPQLPPRWTLGFHLCRYDYKSTEKTEEVWKRTREAGIPFDVQWNDIDYMDRHNDFTYDKERYKGLPDLVKKIHDSGMKYMILFDPGLGQEDNYRPYSLGMEMDIFIKNASDQVLVNKVWNDVGRTVFPDFTNPKSTEYWIKMFKEFHKEIEFDGAWIDMNDISGFVDGSLEGCPTDSPLENPPYLIGDYPLNRKTLCMTAKHKDGVEYNHHSLYSFYEAEATWKALKALKPKERPFILSRSTFSGQGQFGGHWSGDVDSTWTHLRWSIPSLIEFSMYGFPLMGSDICGFTNDTDTELCARWSTIGAFYSFARNHNDDRGRDQDPVALGPVVVEANKNALSVRYILLPYLYTLIHNAHRRAEPYARSLAFEFFQDEESRGIEDQVLIGKALMLAPIMTENSTERVVHLPPGRWFYSSIDRNDKKYELPDIVGNEKAWTDLVVKNISLVELPLFFRGGQAVALYRQLKTTTEEIVQQPLTIEAFLNDCMKSQGEVYLDDGITDDDQAYDHLTFSVANQTMIIKMDVGNYKGIVNIEEISIMGLPNEMRVDNVFEESTGRSLVYHQNEHALVVDVNLAVSKDKPTRISWNSNWDVSYDL